MWQNAAIAGFLALACVMATAAQAQQVVARVNGDPITAIDLAQRMRLLQISGNKSPSRKEALDELIDERLKMQVAQRYRVEIADEEVNRVVANMASRMRANSDQFTKALASAGINIHYLKRKLRADLAWNNVIRGKFQASLQIREKDIELAAQSRKNGDAKAYTYTLRPILLVVPRGAGDAAFAARRREAEGLRTRFQNCEDGIRLARGLRDIAVREPIIRSSGDVSGKQREVLEATPVGRLTPPDVTASGIEVFAVCEKKAGGASGAERDVRDEMFGERFQAKGKEYLRQLRRSAMIELK
jgi:peptidyl-prolyl cis-trans isomerase SurA